MSNGAHIEQISFLGLAKQNMRKLSMFIMLGLILIVFAILTNGVNLTPRNITNIFIQNSYILILAVGMLLVIIIGNIDLSVGSVIAFSGAISAMLYNTGMGMIPMLLLSLLIGGIIGCFQAFWIAYMRIPAFIVTLSGMLLFRGLTYIITNVTPVALIDDGFKQIASGSLEIKGFRIAGLDGLSLLVMILAILLLSFMTFRQRNRKIRNGFSVLPFRYSVYKIVSLSALIIFVFSRFAAYRGIPTVSLVLFVVTVLFVFITNNTVIGRYIYAVGGNMKSAKLSGINAEKVMFITHVIMGVLCGLSGVVFTAYMNSALPQAGDKFELDAIASCYIGGAAASGGIGTIIGAITGGLVMGVINNGMSLMNIGADWQYVVKAAILLFAVFYDIWSRKKSGLG
ncbi:MAG: multiple monosaccharide ABC transporter permease [Sphaerochaetaceae bacterium]|jgi:putative multiple sugar transport system permease protein|nr:sugar ABC transporter permease [Sphaerochaetaceae bacterium]MDD3941433.1 sugar ABC transporter permease [Sphaerochaetaceae bacterium]MDX9938622.1 sugar ABC transporter permease [Sphaerochaetaceae bacterium]